MDHVLIKEIVPARTGSERKNRRGSWKLETAEYKEVD